ncbi:MAG: ankyrin repeat domain-containing protein [Candidatus Micrarchaeaceae archaeon]
MESDNKLDVARLLKEGANANSKGTQDRTALMLAAVKGESTIIKALIKAGAKVDEKDEQGRTALTKAVSLGRVEAAETLVVAKADLEVKDNAGWMSPVHTFADMHLTGAEFLISKGFRADKAADEHPYNLLRLAAKHNDHKLARLLAKLEWACSQNQVIQ